MVADASRFYVNGELIPWDEIPYWYVQFLASSPPDKETQAAAERELKKRLR